MATKFEYTTLAQRYTARYPRLTYVGTQMNFWILANLVLVTVLSLHARLLSQTGAQPVAGEFSQSLGVALLAGSLWGVSLGLAGYYLDRRTFRRLSLGQEILVRALGSLGLMTLLLGLSYFLLLAVVAAPAAWLPGLAVTTAGAGYSYALLLIYYAFMSLMISFINQMHKKFGPGVLVPLLLGRYREPQDEERVFMFMDLQSSTTTAEQLGHRRYSAFIRDCFADINQVLFPFEAQVYQYVGDEIILMWPTREGLRHHCCLRFYFACKRQFRARARYYQDTYGLLPHFKAGVHAGPVTAVEIGEIKKDIAYHGDTLNTAARIQSLCNDYQAELLVSESLLAKMPPAPQLKTEFLGRIALRGKAEHVGLVRANWVDSEAAAS